MRRVKGYRACRKRHSVQASRFHLQPAPGSPPVPPNRCAPLPCSWSCVSILRYNDWVLDVAARGALLLVAAAREVHVHDLETHRLLHKVITCSVPACSCSKRGAWHAAPSPGFHNAATSEASGI